MSRETSRLDRILRALNHPIRRQILRALADRPGSASSMAGAFERELGLVSYHLNRVLAKECDAVDLIEAVPRRGAIEKVYQLNAELWTDLSVEVKASGKDLEALSPGECFLEAVEALDADAFAQLEGSAWDWFPVTVDSKAWKAIQAAKADFDKRVEEAVVQSGERDKRENGATHDVVVGVAAFPAAPRFEP